MRHHRTLVLAILIMIYGLNLMDFSIALPIFPEFFLKSHVFTGQEASEAVKFIALALAFGMFGGGQLLCSLLLGWVGDRWGRRLAMQYALYAGIAASIITVISLIINNFYLLLVGRFISGAAASALVLSYSIASDLSQGLSRARTLGYLVGLGGLGYLIGPWIGGGLEEWFPESKGIYAFGLIGIIYLLALVLFVLFVPETSGSANHRRIQNSDTLSDEKKKLGRGDIVLFICFFMFCLGWNAFLQFLSPYLLLEYKWTAAEIGNAYVYLTAFWIISAAFLNSFLQRFFNIKKLSIISFLLTGVTIAILPRIPLFSIKIVLFTLTPIFAGILFPSTLAIISLRLPSRFHGRIYGINQFLFSGAQLLSALAAGLLAIVSASLPIIFGGIIILIAAIILFWHLLNTPFHQLLSEE